MKGMIFDVERNSFVDGPGIRTTVFFKGCNLNCAWCHNPESRSKDPQMMMYKDKCISCGECAKVCTSPNECLLCGKCTLYCPVSARKLCGREYTADELFYEIVKDKAFFDNSGGGVTFSGGECMLQSDFLAELLKRCKEAGIRTAVDTAGHISFEEFKKTLSYTDLFLYDVKILDSEKHKKYVGVGNELILENLKKLLAVGAKIWVRIPVIAGVNDGIDEMKGIRDFFDKYGYPEKTELLAYHSMGENKYAAIGKTSVRFPAPEKERLNELKAIFK